LCTNDKTQHLQLKAEKEVQWEVQWVGGGGKEMGGGKGGQIPPGRLWEPKKRSGVRALPF